MTAADAEDLTAKVTGWLNSTGAPLEMRVARTLQARELSVRQSVYYEDPEEHRSREIDVIGSREVQVGDSLRIGAYLVIECKSAPKPWVLLRGSPAWDQGGPNFDRILTEYGPHWLTGARSHPAIEQARIFQQEARAGYSLVTATFGTPNNDEPDVAYRALMSATKAARAWADEIGQSEGVTTVGVVFPVAVLRGKLFEATLEGDAIAAREIRRGQVAWALPPGERPVLVDVLTEGVVDEYAGQFRESFEALAKHGKDAATQAKSAEFY
jgi:hypothetical protein